MKNKGFTIIELVVVFPIVAIVIGALLVVLVELVVDNATTKSQSELTYTAQAALDVIERDITYATDFMPNKDSSVIDPYVSDAAGGAWSYTGSSSDVRTLILRGYETQNPIGASTQTLIRSQDNSCDAQQSDNLISYNTVYFVKGGNLYKRILTNTGVSVRCTSAYQKQSCPADLASPNAACKVDDTLLATNVTAFKIDYYSSADNSTPIDAYATGGGVSLDSAVSAQVTISMRRNVAGNNIDASRSVRVAKLNSSAFASAQSRILKCPTNFLLVPGNYLFGTSDFCVMKYEAKNVSNIPTSQAAGIPWGNITQAAAKTASVQACTGCHLITEAEWLTIAHNLLNVASNWTGGSVGSGSLYISHTDNSPANTLAASTDNDSYSGTGNTAPSNQRRTMTLSTGEIIWDVGGNAQEWVDGPGLPVGSIPGISGETTHSWKEWNNPSLVIRGINKWSVPSYGNPAAASWTSTNGLGMLYSYYADTTARIYARGGNYSGGGGIFSMAYGAVPSSVGTHLGFRVTR